jgi:regulator of replication initiation timing
MNLCSNGHDEVCYGTHECPACREIDDLNDQIVDLNRDIDELKITIKELEQENDKLDEIIRIDSQDSAEEIGKL